VTRLEAVARVAREVLPREAVARASGLARVLGHEEEGPALEVPRLDVLVVARDDALQHEERGREELELEAELHEREPRLLRGHAGVV
jgi:hypothetical protein